MSKIPTNNDGLNDADFATLFSSDTSHPPKELDKLVLDNALLSQHNSLPQQHETFTQKYAPIFGTAAILMIAFGLTPLTMNAPESQPDLALEPTPMQETASQPTATDSNQLSTRKQADVVSEDESNQPSRVALAEPESTVQARKAVEPLSTVPNAPLPADASAVVADTSDADTNVLASESADRITQAESSTANTSTNVAVAKSNVAEAASIAADSVANSNATQNGTDKTEFIESAPAATVNSFAETTAEDDTKELEFTATASTAEADTDSHTDTDALGVNTEDSFVRQLKNADSDSVAQANTGVELAGEERSQDSTFKSIDTTELESGVVEMQKNRSRLRGEQEALITTLNSQSVDESVNLKQTPKPDTKLIDDQADSQVIQPAREKAKNYRSSALLWVIEIKHLHKENKTEQALKELALFRKKFPDNDNERLLPKELLKAETD